MAEEPRSGGEDKDQERGGRPGSRYSLWVGIAFLALILVATLNTFSTEEGDLLGTAEVKGQPLAEFAVPDIRGTLSGDSNIYQDDCETGQNPCPAERRRTPACEIDPEGAIRVCDLFDKPLVISFWFTNPDACVETQDSIYALAELYKGRANFLSLAVRGDRAEVEQIVAEREWRVPVGWDRDGAVSNVYRVGVCPTVGIARPGGIFESVLIGLSAEPDAIAAELDGLLTEEGEG